MTQIPTLRRGTLTDLVAALNENHARRLDLIANTANMSMRNGQIVLEDVIVGDEGVARTVTLDCLETFYSGLAEHTNIPIAYVRTLFSEEERRQADALVIAGAKYFGADDSLLDHNVNYWFARQAKQVMVRAYGDPTDGGRGVARAMMSNQYRVFDNLDALFPVIEALRGGGVDVNVTSCDLTERGRMYVRIEAPGLFQEGGPFVETYHHARSNRYGGDYPLVHAGMLLRNDELGGGALTLTPMVVVQICGNGMTRTHEAMRKIHLGARMDEGVWSEETHGRYIDLIKSQVGDLVRTKFNAEWLAATVDDINGVTQVGVTDAEKAVTVLSKRLAWSDERRAEILSAFIGGSMMTVGGFMAAATDVAQQTDSGDTQYDLERDAERIPAILAEAGLTA
jgi:hypothetical protein